MSGFSNGFDEPAGGAFEATYDADAAVLSLTGDGLVPLEPGEFGNIIVAAVQSFTPVGPLPIEVTPELAANFKVPNTGGSSDAGVSTSPLAFATLFETGTFDAARAPRREQSPNPGASMSFDLFGPRVLDTPTQVGPQVVGNGFTVSDLQAAGSPYVLTPGVLLEAGGISTFDGLRVALNPRSVPEPAGLILAGLALRRRRAAA